MDLLYERSTFTPVDCISTSCPWEHLLSNEAYSSAFNFTNNFPSNPEDFFINRPNPPQLACVPESFGYDSREAEILFPLTIFPTCEDKQQEHEEIIHINHSTNSLHMTCKDSGVYYLGNKISEELIGLEMYSPSSRTSDTFPVSLEHEIEWSYGSCRNSFFSEPEGATYMHFPNKTLINEVSDTMKNVQSWFGLEPHPIHPLTVLMISLDSMSRSHFHRRLPITRKFLQSLSTDAFRIHDFKIHNIVGDNSIPNVYGILTGKPMPYYSSTRRFQNSEMEKDLIKQDAIWTYLKKRGWATLFGTEFCDSYFSIILGRKPEVDHLLGRFWCAAEALSGFEDKLQDQRCIGNKNSHYYMLNYTLQYVKNYQGINKWGHVMILPAHEDSGTVVSTLDQDLADFLAEVLRTKDRIILFLLADHGPRYGNRKKTLEGAQEHKLPLLMTVSSTSLLEEIPYSYDILEHNTKRLVSKFDIHKTLRHIAHLPYQRAFSRTSYYNNAWGAGLHKANSLLLEKISDLRTCEEASIDKDYCSCQVFNKFKLELQMPEIQEFVQKIAREVVSQMNEETQTNFNAIGTDLCLKVNLKSIVGFEWMKANNFKQYFKLRIMVMEHQTAVVEALVVVTKFKLGAKNARICYPQKHIYHYGKFYFKIEYFRRTDQVEEACQKSTLLLKISPSLCFCKDIN